MRHLVLLLGLAIGTWSQCDVIPSALWCLNPTIEKQCGFSKHCDRYRSATRNKPVLLTVLSEALCPDCQEWITETLYPKIFKNFADFVNIEIVPYGNARYVNGSIKCQHGPEECEINRFESCLIDSMEQQQQQYVPLIYCIEQQLKLEFPFDKAASKCFRTLSVDEGVQRMIQSCLVSRLGAELQKAAAERTDNIWPEKHTHVPWIMFNNISIGAAQLLMDDIPSLICQWYNGDKKIPYCQTMEKKLWKRVSHNF